MTKRSPANYKYRGSKAPAILDKPISLLRGSVYMRSIEVSEKSLPPISTVFHPHLSPPPSLRQAQDRQGGGNYMALSHPFDKLRTGHFLVRPRDSGQDSPPLVGGD